MPGTDRPSQATPTVCTIMYTITQRQAELVPEGLPGLQASAPNTLADGDNSVLQNNEAKKTAHQSLLGRRRHDDHAQ